MTTTMDTPTTMEQFEALPVGTQVHASNASWTKREGGNWERADGGLVHERHFLGVVTSGAVRIDALPDGTVVTTGEGATLNAQTLDLDPAMVPVHRENFAEAIKRYADDHLDGEDTSLLNDVLARFNLGLPDVTVNVTVRAWGCDTSRAMLADTYTTAIGIGFNDIEVNWEFDPLVIPVPAPSGSCACGRLTTQMVIDALPEHLRDKGFQDYETGDCENCG